MRACVLDITGNSDFRDSLPWQAKNARCAWKM
jgi:hypothetical protein